MTLSELKALAEAAKQQLAPGPWNHDRAGYIWAPSLKGGGTPVAMTRGWGYLIGQGHGGLGLSEDQAKAVQDAWGDFIAACHPDQVLELLDIIEDYRDEARERG